MPRILPFKPKLLLAIVWLAGWSAPLLDGATSGVVGVYPIQLPAGNSAWVCGLVTADEHEAAAAHVTTDTDGKALVTFTDVNWAPGQFSLHYAEPQSGTCAGLAFDIISHTADTLKLNTTPAAGGLVSGMTLIIRKHATLGGLLADGGGFLPFTDSISLFGSNGLQSSYFFNNISGRWINGAGVDSHNVVIRPGQGFVIQVTNPLTLMLGRGEVCHVKTSPTKIAVSSGAPNLVGPLNPLGVSTTLGSLGIAGSLQVFNDSLVVLTPGSLDQSGTYLSTGSGLVNGAGQPSNNVPLPTGAGVVINVDAPKNVSLNPVTVSP